MSTKELALFAAYHIELNADGLRKACTTADGRWDPDVVRLHYLRLTNLVQMLRREAGVPDPVMAPAATVTPVGPEADWHDPGSRVPEPLHDVLVIWSPVGDMEPVVDMAYRRRDGRWVLTGSEPELIIEPWAWTPLPSASCYLAGRAQA